MIAVVMVPAIGRAEDPALDRCRSISDSPTRLRCYDDALPKGPPSRTSRSFGAWRLLETPNPQGGPGAISITRTADPLSSGPEFVGLMLRCGAADIEVLLVVIPPLPPRAKPMVSVGRGSDAHHFAARVTPPGAAILLPDEISAEARALWPQRKRIEFTIAHEGAKSGGIVDLDDFAPALRALTTACAGR